VGYAAALELPSKEDSAEPWDTWQRRSSSQQRGEVQGRETRGGAGAHLCRKVRSGAKGHMAAPELTSARRRGPVSKWFYDTSTGAALEQPDVVLLWRRSLASWLLALGEYGGHEDLRGSGHLRVIPYVHGITELYCAQACLAWALFLTLGATRHAAAPKPTSAGRCGLNLQLTW
jgi:hypothetical protein